MDLRLSLKKTYSSNIAIQGGHMWFFVMKCSRWKETWRSLHHTTVLQVRNRGPKVGSGAGSGNSTSLPLFHNSRVNKTDSRGLGLKVYLVPMLSLCLKHPLKKKRGGVGEGCAFFILMSSGNQAALTSLFGKSFTPAQQELLAADVCTSVPFGQGNQVNKCENHLGSNGNRMGIILALKNPIY